MTGGNKRAALAALDAARPVVARLDVSRNAEDLAADVIDAWNAAETSLRALVGGSALGGQALITDLRARQMLTLDQTHALLAFLAARDRVQRTSYRPTAADIAAAREGFQKLEMGLVVPGMEPGPMPGAAAAAPAPTAVIEPDRPDQPARWRRRFSPLVLGIALVVVAALVAGGIWYANRETPYERGTYEYRRGNLVAARDYLERAASSDRDDARPHVILGRIARDQNDVSGARRHLEEAIRLDPSLGAAHREMGSLMLAVGNAQLARNFYERAIRLSPHDRDAQGWMGCALIRLGQFDLGMRFIGRAGQGPWSSCVPLPAAPRR